MIRIRALEIVVRQPLRCRDHVRLAAHVASGEKSLEREGALRPLMVEIDPTRVRRGSQQTRQVVGLQPAIERAEQRTDESLSAAQLTTHTSDEVIGEWLGDSLAESAVVTAEARDLAAGHRVENPRRPSAGGAAGHLHGAEYARFVRDIARV